ncbi:hypothetical protein ACFL6R_00320 [Gemmatimonadota bacterium]
MRAITIQKRLQTIVLVLCVGTGAVFLMQCSRSGEADVDGTVGESTSVPVIRTADSPRHDGELYSVEEDLVLGIDEGEPEWQIFGRSIWFELGPDGLIYLMDRIDRTVHIVGKDGELLGEFGRSGSGPGEFQMVNEMIWRDDIRELWINDMRLFRITRFAPDGELIDTINYANRDTEWMRVLYLGGDRFLASRWDRSGGGGDMISYYGFLDEEMDYTEDFLTTIGQKNIQTTANSWMPMPFVLGAQVAPSPRGLFVVGYPDDGRLEVYNDQGVLTRTIEHSGERIRILNEEKQAWLERMRSTPMVEAAYLNRVQLPDYRQAFFTIHLDDEDRIWIERTRSHPRDTPPVYDVISIDGEWLGVQTLTDRPGRIANGYLYQVVTSEDHGPIFVRYRMVPRYQE